MADGKVVIDTQLDGKGLKKGLSDAAKTAEQKGTEIEKAIEKPKKKLDETGNKAQEAGKKTSDGMNKAKDGTNKFADAADKAAKKTKDIDKGVSELKEALDKNNDALEKAKQKYIDSYNQTGKNSAQTKKYAREIREASVEVNKTQRDYNNASKSADQFDKSLKKTSESADKAKNALHGLGEKAKSLGAGALKAAGAGIAAVSTAIIGIGANAVKYNASMEQYQTSFEVMTGSAEEAASLMERLKNLGATTPFEFTDLADATQTLMAFGFSADEAYEQFKLLGDISQGNADKLGSITRAWGKMHSAQKVSLEDINMMIDAGFNPLQTISDKTGESMKSLYDRISKGTMSVEEIGQAMQDATSEGGQFYQSMEKQSQTLSGKISTLKDNFQQLTGSIFSGVSSEGGDIVSIALGWINQLQTTFEEQGPEAMVTALGDILAQAVGFVAEQAPTIIQMAINIIMAFLQGISDNQEQILTGAVQIITTLSNGIIEMLPQIIEMGIQLLLNLIIGISQALPQLIPTIIEAVLTIINTLLDNIDLLIDAGFQLLLGLVNGLINAIPTLIQQAPTIIQKLVSALITNLPKIIQAGLKIIVALANGLIQAIPQLVARVPQIITAIVNGLRSGIAQVTAIGRNIVEGIWNGISGAVTWIKDKITGWVGDVLGFMKGLFGIHSPSTLFRDEIGVYLAKGIWVGFDKANPMDAIADSVKYGIGNLETAIHTTAISDIGSGINNGFRQINNKPIYTTMYINGRQFAVATSGDMTTAQSNDVKIQNMIRGVR